MGSGRSWRPRPYRTGADRCGERGGCDPASHSPAYVHRRRRISGVAVLAESHISVHTWPEKGYAAFDVFMCGDAQPRKAMEVFKRAFNPGRVVIGEHKRGVL
ncbi:MAG: adenosylmethionine decarboxylase [Rhizomicrobium sp.]